MINLPKETVTKTLNALAQDKGIELTPVQLNETLVEVCCKVREAMKKRGYSPPEDDMEMLEIIRAAFRSK